MNNQIPKIGLDAVEALGYIQAICNHLSQVISN
jgi:hypothetical protein